LSAIGPALRLITATAVRRASKRYGFRSWITAALWMLGAALAQRRRAQFTVRDVQRHDFRWQTRRMGMRQTEWLRDRLRTRWLRLRRRGE
jgi:hypothetical protein